MNIYFYLKKKQPTKPLNLLDSCSENSLWYFSEH